jgi:hypothetical protein
MSDKELTVVNEQTGEILTQPKNIELTSAGIERVVRNIQMAEKLVTQVLEMNVDWGIQPGTNSMALRDPGSSKIANAFNCYPEHAILKSEDTPDVIFYTMRANMINRDTGQVVAVGVGGCSSRESKYGKRWVVDPESFGLNREDYKFRESDKKYHIPNPDIPDLGNTILKMAAKRAEVDACQNLPGVGSALRKLFDPQFKKSMPITQSSETVDLALPVFWAIMHGAGLTDDDVHKACKVASMNDWTASGKTLREATIFILGTAVKAIRNVAKKPAPPPAPAPVAVEKLPKDITKEDVPNVETLVNLVKKYWNMPEQELWQAVGYTGRGNFLEAQVQTSYEIWLAILEQKSG